jgi:hypothetical protein
VAGRKKSLNQVTQLAMSGTLLTGEKKIRDIMTSLLPPPDRGLHPELATMVDRRSISAENAQKGDSSGDNPSPNWDPAPSAKVITRGLSAPVSRWKVRYYLLWIDGSPFPVHAPLLGINVEEPWGSHNGRKAKGHFPTRQWDPFLCLTFLSWYLFQWQKLSLGSKSGQPLERYFTRPLTCSWGDLLFCHSS